MSDYYHCENKKPITTAQKETTTSVSMGGNIAFYLVSIVFIAIIVVLFLKVYNKQTPDVGIGSSVIDKYRKLILGSIIIFVIIIIIIVSIMYIAPQASKASKKRK